MNSIHSRALAIGGAILTLGLGGVAAAQQSPAPVPASKEGWQRPDPAAMAARRAEHLRTALQLRPDQEPALTTFMATMKPPGDRGERMRGDRQAMAKLTTPERLDRMQARMDERRARFVQVSAATKKFYAALSPAQQKAFDALQPMGGRDGGRGGHMGGHRGGGDHGPGMPG